MKTEATLALAQEEQELRGADGARQPGKPLWPRNDIVVNATQQSVLLAASGKLDDLGAPLNAADIRMILESAPTARSAAPAVDAAKLDDLGKLKALAEAATQGEWAHQRHGAIVAGPVQNYVNGSGQEQIAMTTGTLWMRKDEHLANAEYIGAANPAAILRIAALVAQQAARIADLVSALAAAREMVGHPDNVAFIDRTLAGATKEGK